MNDLPRPGLPTSKFSLPYATRPGTSQRSVCTCTSFSHTVGIAGGCSPSSLASSCCACPCALSAESAERVSCFGLCPFCLCSPGIAIKPSSRKRCQFQLLQLLCKHLYPTAPFCISNKIAPSACSLLVGQHSNCHTVAYAMRFRRAVRPLSSSSCSIVHVRCADPRPPASSGRRSGSSTGASAATAASCSRVTTPAPAG